MSIRIIRRFPILDLDDEELDGHRSCEAWWTECYDDPQLRCVDQDGDSHYMCRQHADNVPVS